MGLSEWLNLVLGAGFLSAIGALIKIFVIDKQSSEATNKKVLADARKVESETGEAEMLQIIARTKITSQLLSDINESAENARKLQTEQDKLLREKNNLQIELEGAKAQIDYQKDERKDWMEMLKATLDANAVKNREFDEMLGKVKVLEEKEKFCAENVASLEGRLNLLVGILRNNNLEMPEGFVWVNSESQQAYPANPKSE